jgi:hypothetical protein
MMNSTAWGAAALFAMAAALPCSARAEWFGGVGLTSDHIERAVSQSDERASFDAHLGWRHRAGAYAILGVATVSDQQFTGSDGYKLTPEIGWALHALGADKHGRPALSLRGTALSRRARRVVLDAAAAAAGAGRAADRRRLRHAGSQRVDRLEGGHAVFLALADRLPRPVGAHCRRATWSTRKARRTSRSTWTCRSATASRSRPAPAACVYQTSTASPPPTGGSAHRCARGRSTGGCAPPAATPTGCAGARETARAPAARRDWPHWWAGRSERMGQSAA